MTSRHDHVVEVARRWLGTPYRHQQSCRGVGTDCLGLIRGIWREVVGAEPETVPAYTADWSEAFAREDLLTAASRWLRPGRASGPSTGEVLLFRMQDGAVAKHLAVLTEDGDRPRFIHAYQGHGVVESTLSAPWARRVIAWYEFPQG